MTKTISPSHRYPCGKRKKTTAERLNDLERERADSETIVVRMQPHRRQFGSNAASPLAACPIGQFILIAVAPKFQGLLFDAAEGWGTVYRKWINAQPEAPRLPGDGGSDGADVPYELIYQWSKEWRDGLQVMQEAAGTDGALSVARMAVYWESIAPGASKQACVRALAALAVQRGKIDSKDLWNVEAGS